MSDVIKQGKLLIELLKNKLNNIENVYKDEMDLEMIYKIASFHSLNNALYYSINNFNLDESLKNLLEKDHMLLMTKAYTFDAEAELLNNMLNDLNINHMFLKGSLLKHLYPSIDFRSMADLDIYIDKTKASKVKEMMIGLGYNVEQIEKGNHDVYQKKPFMDVEIHRDLMNECYSFHKYFKNTWDKLIVKDKNEYEFKNEDYYIFMIAHAAKHFSNGGTGIRSVMDEFVYLREFDDKLNKEYINQELDVLGLVKFENNLRCLANYWFKVDYQLPEENKEVIERMEEYIINAGTYGTSTNSIVRSVMDEKGYNNISSSKFKFYLNKAFPSYRYMCSRNHILKKIPILLPWFWFTRILKALFRKNSTKGQIKSIQAIDDKKIEEIKQIKEDSGVEL